MVNGAIAATDTNSELVAAEKDRGSVTLQYVSGDPVYLAFGTDVPVVGSGLVLSSTHAAITIDDFRAIQAINGICDTGLTTTGTYATDTGAITIGGPDIAALGTTTDVPLAAETAEDATARSHTSLLKRAVNKLIDIKAYLYNTGKSQSVAELLVSASGDTAPDLLYSVGAFEGVADVAFHALNDGANSAADLLVLIKTAVEKGGLGESVATHFLSWGNTDPMVPGTSVDAKVLAADQAYISATIKAEKEVAGATQPAIPNVGTVWICGAAEDLEGGFSLLPGQSMDLQPNGNLHDYFGAVTDDDDGLSISYTV